MGLIKAIFRFCPEKGDDIVSFAAPTILGEIKQYLRDSSWWLRPPRRVQELAVTISHTEPMVNQMLGRSATTLELAGYLGVAQDDVVAAVTCLDFKYPLSLDAPVEPDTAASDTLGSLLAHDEDDYATREVPLVLREACKQLNLEERTIILYRFYKDWTQREIAQLLGVSQMHVSRSIQRALTILRNTLQRSTAQQ